MSDPYLIDVISILRYFNEVMYFEQSKKYT